MKKSVVLLIALLLFTVLAPLCHADSFDPADYQVLELGTLNNKRDTVKAYAINDNSQIVGVVTNSKGKDAAFVYSSVKDNVTFTYSGSMAAVDSSAIESRAYDINNAGQIVGDNVTGSKRRPVYSSYIAQNGVVTNIVSNGTAYSVNSSGQVVGSVDGQAYIWSANDGGSLLGQGLQTAVSINATGVVVGQDSIGEGYVLNTATGDLVTYYSSYYDVEMKSVNSSGSSIATIDVGGGIVYSYFIDGENILSITATDKTSIEALSMNDKGQVVGTADGRAFVWDETYGMFDLNNLLPVDSGWDYLVAATDINNLGQIVGWGMFNGDVRSFLLTRVTAIETSTFFMILCSGLVIIIHYRRKHQHAL